MKDNDIYKIIIPIITSGLTADGYTGFSVKQSNQPTQQGVNTEPTVFISKISDHRYGYLKRTSDWDSEEEKMVHTESQIYESVFQIGALVLQSPSNTNLYTASDFVNSVAEILQSDSTIEALRINNLGILRITDLRNPYFVDDRNNFEASPSFDFTLIHTQTRVSEDAVVESFEYDIKRV